VVAERSPYARRGPSSAVDLDTDLRAFFEARSDVRLAYLYGSMARGDADAHSDIDVAVFQGEDDEDPLLLRMGAELQRVLRGHAREVELRSLRGAGAEFVFRVLRDGRCVFARDERERVAFETRGLSEYYDLLPFLEEQNRAIRGRLGGARA
jgi:predicted nucleotidyltransferase